MRKRITVIALTFDDVKVETFRAANQQAHENPRGVRVTLLSNGLYAECQEHRSYFKNREVAMETLTKMVNQRKSAT